MLLTSVNVVVIFCDIYVSDYGACVNSVYDNSQYLEGIHERLLFSLDFMNTCCILTQLYLTAIKYFLHSSKFDTIVDIQCHLKPTQLTLCYQRRQKLSILLLKYPSLNLTLLYLFCNVRLLE